MFARKKPANPAETSIPTPAPTDAPGEAATPSPEPTATAEASILTLAAADALEDAVTPPSGPAPAAASAARSARPVAAAARPKAPSFFAADLAFVGNLSGEGDVHLAGPFEGDIRVRDVTVGAGGRVEGSISGRRIEVLGRVHGGLVADEVKVRVNAQVDGDVTSESFTLDTGSRFEGRSKRKKSR